MKPKSRLRLASLLMCLFAFSAFFVYRVAFYYPAPIVNPQSVDQIAN